MFEWVCGFSAPVLFEFLNGFYLFSDAGDRFLW